MDNRKLEESLNRLIKQATELSETNKKLCEVIEQLSHKVLDVEKKVHYISEKLKSKKLLN